MDLLEIAYRYQKILACMVSSKDALAELREVNEIIAAAEDELARKRSGDGILAGNEDDSEPHRP